MSIMYNVKNRGASTVVYKIPEDGIRRSFAPGEVKRISSEELEKLTYQPGGIVILSQFLQIQDLEGIKLVNIKTEPEYHMSETDVIKLITKDSLDAFLDALDFAPIGVIDLIKKLSVEIPMVDMQKRKALKLKTGFDVDAAIRHNEEDKEDEKQDTILKQTSERRVKPAETSVGRRTAPDYKIVSQTADAANAESAK